MKLSKLISRNVFVGSAGGRRRTSMRLEASMWDALEDIARREKLRDVDALVTLIEARALEHPAPGASLTSSVRVFVAEYYRAAATEEGHRLAGHGGGEPFSVSPNRSPAESDDRETPSMDLMSDQAMA